MINKLREARQAIKEFNPELAAKILSEIEAAAPPVLDGPEAEAVAIELRAIRDYAAAAGDGIAAAQLQLKELMQLTQTLGSYDRAGNRRVEDISARTRQKY